MLGKPYQDVCSKIAGTATCNMLSLYCDENMLAVIQLATTHNVSINFLSPAERTMPNPRNQLIVSSSVFARGNYSLLTPLHLSNTVFSQDAYCSLPIVIQNFPRQIINFG